MEFRDSLPSVVLSGITSRSKFVLTTLGLDEPPDLPWKDLLISVSRQPQGLFYLWLVVSGVYPTKLEFQKFLMDIQVNGIWNSIQTLIADRTQNPTSFHQAAFIELKPPPSREMVDITHTSSASYLTGIQRVVFGITHNQHKASTFVWLGINGIIQEESLSNLENPKKKQQPRSPYSLFVESLQSFGFTLNRSHFGQILNIVLLPPARAIKRKLMWLDLERQIKNLDRDPCVNILLNDCRITLAEIPSEVEQISQYEVLAEYSNVRIQIVLHDFIPFFYAWTVEPGNRGHFNSYIRLVLLAERIICVSALVQEQLQLITKAFNLAYVKTQQKNQIFDFMSLPSGVEPGKDGEFEKDPNLIVMLGSLEPRKNHLQFLSAIELLTNQGIPVIGRILGSAGWGNDHILKYISQLQAKGINVDRLSNITDEAIRRIVGKAQVLVQISHAEGFGLPVREALALGTKVIVSNIRPLNEWTSNRVSAVEIGDVSGLADLLQTALVAPESFGEIISDEISWQDWQKLLFD